MPDDVAFVNVTVSPDGSRVAATSDPSQGPLVCVWERKTGRMTHRLTGASLEVPAGSLAFSSDARHLLTAGDSLEARLWDLSAGEGEPAAPARKFRGPGAGARNISAVAIRPGDSRQVVIGHRDGSLRLWGWRDGRGEPDRPTDLAPNYFPGAVKAITFLVNGPEQYLAVAGDGTSIWAGRILGRPARAGGPGPPPPPLRADQYVGQLALAAARTGRGGILVSGSDDTAVKLDVQGADSGAPRHVLRRRGDGQQPRRQGRASTWPGSSTPRRAISTPRSMAGS